MLSTCHWSQAGVSAVQLPDAAVRRSNNGTHESKMLPNGRGHVSNVRCSLCRFVEGSSSNAKRAQWQCLQCSSDDQHIVLCIDCWSVWHRRQDLNKVRKERLNKRLNSTLVAGESSQRPPSQLHDRDTVAATATLKQPAMMMTTTSLDDNDDRRR